MRNKLRVWLVSGTLLTMSCSLAQAQSARPAGVTDEELFGTVIRQSKWETLPIQVCWENPGENDARYRAITRSAVEETWERHSAVRFTGWRACAANDSGIHIRIADEGPHVKALGRYLDKRPEGMVLNFTFANWSPGCQRTQDFCVYAIAAHEFGHALGFAHEQNRPDAPAQCRAENAQGTTGDYNVTKYDPFSIMNYCNPTWNGDGKLSELDIEAVQKFYGK
ncbi:M12 family metallopeptidase [Sinorhizobium sojae]|uniref:M12 family metallopeptidase n=1 Tax=Sinorhizobium sojae TaxID=716925 RepID=UPI0005559006|nr:M12 family metallopeptidase [Sinorhizobium sojae]